MKFRITKTSLSFYRRHAPCEGAYVDKTVQYKGHTEEQRFWAIEINSLEDLLALCEAEGEIIVSEPDMTSDNLPQLEIYDDFRE